MTNVIKMDYALMEEMSLRFHQGTVQLRRTRAEMERLAVQMDEGALVGQGGAAFVEALQYALCPAITRLSDKYSELQGDILKAMKAMKDADQDAKSKFS